MGVLKKYECEIAWTILVLLSIYTAVRYFAVYEPIIFEVLGVLFRAYIIYLAWHFSYELTIKSKSIKPVLYLKAIGILAIVAFVAWSRVGTYIENADPMFGGGDIIVDYEPTDGERNEHGWTIFFLLLIPSLIGISKGFKERKHQEMIKK